MEFKDIMSMLLTDAKDADIRYLDLGNKNDYNKFNELIDELKENNVFSTIINGSALDDLKDLAKDLHEKLSSNKEKTGVYEKPKTVAKEECEKETCDMNCSECELDYCVKCDDECVEDQSPVSILPSANIKNIDTKMQIHRLTQEYVDTMLKPYMEKGENTTNNINNAYTALFEFACWIINHK